MVTIKIRHIMPNQTRGFNGLKYDSAIRAEWIRENKDNYMDVAKIQYNYMTKQKAMNTAFSDTNSVDQYWVDKIQSLEDGEGNTKIYPFHSLVGGHRSTSVGDIMEVTNGDKPAVEYFVDSSGFSLVAKDSYLEG